MSPNDFYLSDQERVKLDEAFACVEPAISSFSKKYGDLHLKKYDKGAANWVLAFARKQGGIATITIGFDQQTNQDFLISLISWRDDYDNALRRLKFSTVGSFRMGSDIKLFEKLLCDAMDTLRSWTPNKLDQVAGPMNEWKRHWKSKADFERSSLADLPILSI